MLHARLQKQIPKCPSSRARLVGEPFGTDAWFKGTTGPVPVPTLLSFRQKANDWQGRGNQSRTITDHPYVQRKVWFDDHEVTRENYYTAPWKEFWDGASETLKNIVHDRESTVVDKETGITDRELRRSERAIHDPEYDPEMIKVSNNDVSLLINLIGTDTYNPSKKNEITSKEILNEAASREFQKAATTNRSIAFGLLDKRKRIHMRTQGELKSLAEVAKAVISGTGSKVQEPNPKNMKSMVSEKIETITKCKEQYADMEHEKLTLELFTPDVKKFNEAMEKGQDSEGDIKEYSAVSDKLILGAKLYASGRAFAGIGSAHENVNRTVPAERKKAADNLGSLRANVMELLDENYPPDIRGVGEGGNNMEKQGVDPLPGSVSKGGTNIGEKGVSGVGFVSDATAGVSWNLWTIIDKIADAKNYIQASATVGRAVGGIGLGAAVIGFVGGLIQLLVGVSKKKRYTAALRGLEHETNVPFSEESLGQNTEMRSIATSEISAASEKAKSGVTSMGWGTLGAAVGIIGLIATSVASMGLGAAIAGFVVGALSLGSAIKGFYDKRKKKNDTIELVLDEVLSLRDGKSAWDDASEIARAVHNRTKDTRYTANNRAAALKKEIKPQIETEKSKKRERTASALWEAMNDKIGHVGRSNALIILKATKSNLSAKDLEQIPKISTKDLKQPSKKDGNVWAAINAVSKCFDSV
ncbi:MAG: hypothetical protein GY835_19755 [bacterium]|nr:hypothetical protein [bacterium]